MPLVIPQLNNPPTTNAIHPVGDGNPVDNSNDGR